MDDFGQPIDEHITEEDEGRDRVTHEDPPSSHDRTTLPVIQHPPSPAPFSHYAPTTPQRLPPSTAKPTSFDIEQGRDPDDRAEAGCCSKCVIM